MSNLDFTLDIDEIVTKQFNEYIQNERRIEYEDIASALNELNPEQLHIMTGWLLEAGNKETEKKEEKNG